MSYFPKWQVKTSGVIAPDETLPANQTIALGIQHVVAMFGSTILAPILMGFDPNVAVLMSGIGTLIFFLMVGGRVPSYLGSSFAFIGVVIAATGYAAGSGLNPNIEVALGGIMACGIDPAKTHIFIQSMVPELTELSFYYMNLVTVSRLQRNPTVKSEIHMRNFETSIPVGFFCYPISQAADITAFHATTVPAGEDQKPMIEQCCEIVRKFNAVYGDTLTEPEIVLPQNAACLRLPGTDGKAKMSKSLGNCIYLSEEPEDIKKKVMSMYTDPNHLRVQDPGKVEGNPVFIYLDAFCRPEHFAEFLPEYQNLDELKAHYQRGGLGDVKVKKFLNSVMQAELEPIRTRRKEWEQRLPEVVEILKEGSAYAEKTAAATLAEVRKSMRIDYFDNDNLLK